MNVLYAAGNVAAGVMVAWSHGRRGEGGGIVAAEARISSISYYLSYTVCYVVS